MVEFLSVLIGLYTGVHVVELGVVGEVAAIEIRLDGTTLTTLSGPPWEFECDFGPTPAPHELVAIARASAGHEIDRATRWVNLADSTSAAAMSFETDGRGRPTAVEISWQSIGMRQPRTVELLFDGEPLEVADPRRVPLPRYDPDRIHFVSATVRFMDEQVSRLEASFGGALGEEIRTELTAVAVSLEKGASIPEPFGMQGWFLEDGAPLTVHGVEKGPAEVILVRDPTVQPYLGRLAVLALKAGELADDSRPEASPDSWLDSRNRRTYRHNDLRHFAWLGEDVYLRFLAPGAAPLVGEGLNPGLFPHSPRYGAEEGGLLRISQRLPEMQFPMRFADAVATAGMAVHGTHRRRAVVLLLADAPGDRSQHGAQGARAYLRQLHVPVFVWSFAGGPLSSEWSDARSIGLQPRSRKVPSGFKEALAELKRTLQSQRIVWLEGRHLPQDIELSPAARGIRLAGR